MLKQLLVVIVTTLLISCHHRTELSSDDYVNFDFVDTINISHDSRIELIQPKYVSVAGEYVIVTNSKGEFFFQVYNKYSLELVGLFGKRGRGPNEYLSPRIIKTYQGDNDIMVDIYDSRNRKYCIVEINRAIEDHSYTPDIELLPNQVFSPEEIIYKNRDTLIYTPDNSFENSRFSLFYYSTKHIKSIPFLPELENGVSTINSYPIYNTISSLYTPCIKTISLASSMLGQVDFFSLDGDYMYSKIIERQKQLQYSGKNQLISEFDPVRYQSEIRSTRHGILLMYTKYYQSNEHDFSEFYFLNWNNKNNRKVITDKVCMSFDIDKLSNKLFILFYENERFYLSKQEIFNDQYNL
ncbi:hypothetical protein [Carboxylicivirga sp. N1Y90]|uniref:hypothetical protein n=1 Tax=Carboxylicivirga fragile TaxID=3417571 RepID=UPI003D33CB4A|nr:hypothetical protein [Marinilabiliaceae bacterium N1Y90]